MFHCIVRLDEREKHPQLTLFSGLNWFDEMGGDTLAPIENEIWMERGAPREFLSSPIHHLVKGLPFLLPSSFHEKWGSNKRGTRCSVTSKWQTAGGCLIAAMQQRAEWVSLRFPYSGTLLFPYCQFPYKNYEPFYFHTVESSISILFWSQSFCFYTNRKQF